MADELKRLSQNDADRIIDANLSGADLRNAILKKAKLAGANFEGADLAGADGGPRVAKPPVREDLGRSAPRCLLVRTREFPIGGSESPGKKR
jgi:hypothetical protein